MEELSANKFFRYKYLIVCILSPLSTGGGGLSLLPNFLKGGELDRISVFKGGLLRNRGVTFLRDVTVFT